MPARGVFCAKYRDNAAPLSDALRTFVTLPVMRIQKSVLMVAVAMGGLAVIAGAVETAPPMAPQVKGRTIALVGGTLIDGYGGVPVQNSVILVDNERITAVGQVGSLAVPAGAE